MASAGIGQQVDERSDVSVRFDRVPQRKLGVDLIAIPAAGADSLQVLAFLEVRDDPLDGTLGDSNQYRDLAERHLWVARDGQQDMPVVAEECPGWATGV
jgi:hypothetical protein